MARNRDDDAPEKSAATEAGEARERTQLVVLRNEVLRVLGKPPRFERVEVHSLGAGRFRANVLVDTTDRGSDGGPAFARVGISDSFYLWADDTGAVEQASPPLKRKYPRVK